MDIQLPSGFTTINQAQLTIRGDSADMIIHVDNLYLKQK